MLTERKEADQKEALKRVRELALSRCGVRVEIAPWLAGRSALDEFLNNHRRVLDLIIRHRLACGMWLVPLVISKPFRLPLAIPSFRGCDPQQYECLLDATRGRPFTVIDPSSTNLMSSTNVTLGRW